MASLQQSQLGGTLCSHQCAQLWASQFVHSLALDWDHNGCIAMPPVQQTSQEEKHRRAFTKRRFTAQRHSGSLTLSAQCHPPWPHAIGRTAGMDHVLRPAHIRLFAHWHTDVRACVRPRAHAMPQDTRRSTLHDPVGRSVGRHRPLRVCAAPKSAHGYFVGTLQRIDHIVTRCSALVGRKRE